MRRGVDKYFRIFLRIERLKRTIFLNFSTSCCHDKLLSMITPRSFSCFVFSIVVSFTFKYKSLSMVSKWDYFDCTYYHAIISAPIVSVLCFYR